MGERTETKEVVRQLTDATVVADMGVHRWYGRDPEMVARDLEIACKEFHDHCRDHRSLDHIRLTVERVYQFVCPECGGEYDNQRQAQDCLDAHADEVPL